MHIAALVDMIDSGLGDRVLVGSRLNGSVGSDVARQARQAAALLRESCTSLVYAGENSPLLPTALLGAAYAGVPFVPVNYRTDDHQLVELIERQAGHRVIADAPTTDRLRRHGIDAMRLDEWSESLARARPVTDPADNDNDVAVVLYTSGTTSAPKAALLRHRHLMAYLLQTVEYAGASETDATLVSVPPYHIAGMANLLSNLFAGRRLVYMDRFDAAEWLSVIRAEEITNAMIVPTMLARVVDAVDAGEVVPPTLRTLAYGGSAIPERVLIRALQAFPNTDFVNAYGLTETASTIALLGPDDHRSALASDNDYERRRLRSAGKILPQIEAQVRGDDGLALDADDVGLLFVRGEQISGEYTHGSDLDQGGWFCTRDRASIDSDGYLYLEGRADDVIIRGGENIAPIEIEEVFCQHPAVKEACVVGLPDDEWGHKLCAAIVLKPDLTASPTELREFVRRHLRSSKTPDHITIRDELPYTDTGKLLRRVIAHEMATCLPVPPLHKEFQNHVPVRQTRNATVRRGVPNRGHRYPGEC